MKVVKGVDDLAASLTAAAAAPLVAERPSSLTSKAGKGGAAIKVKGPIDTVQLTLRPTRTLYAHYVGAAADRSKQEGRTVSVQEVMLEILQRGLV